MCLGIPAQIKEIVDVDKSNRNGKSIWRISRG